MLSAGLAGLNGVDVERVQVSGESPKDKEKI